MNYEDKRVPLNLVCKQKNKERLTNLLNEIIKRFEVDGKSEDEILTPKTVTKIERVEHNYYTFFEPSNRVGEDFISLMDCLNNNNQKALNQHFEKEKTTRNIAPLCPSSPYVLGC